MPTDINFFKKPIGWSSIQIFDNILPLENIIICQLIEVRKSGAVFKVEVLKQIFFNQHMKIIEVFKLYFAQRPRI